MAMNMGSNNGFPHPPMHDVKQDDAVMHYVCDGRFEHGDLGQGRAGLPDGIKTERLTIAHVPNEH